jgi:hypothetical protein
MYDGHTCAEPHAHFSGAERTFIEKTERVCLGLQALITSSADIRDHAQHLLFILHVSLAS